MTIKELAYKIENLRIIAENVNSLQMALYTAIYEGSTDVKEYEGAFNAFGDLCFSLKGKVSELEDKAFDSFRKGENSGE